MSAKTLIRSIRISLAKFIWPKTVKQGELFTIVRWLRDGEPWIDGSWVGATLRADIVDGERIAFSELSEYSNPPRWERIPSCWLIPGHNTELQVISGPLAEPVRKTMRERARIAKPEPSP